MDSITKVLMTKKVRLSTSTRWLVFDDGEWFVYEQKHREMVHLVARTASQKIAIAALLEGEDG